MKHLPPLWFALLFAVDPSFTIASELILSPDYRIADLRQMPIATTPPGLSFQQRDYPEHDAVEWQVRLEAPDAGDSPLYEDLASADFEVQFPAGNQIALHWNVGSHAKDTDFRPRVDLLAINKPFSLESFGGRSSDGVMPYFNLQSEGGGLIFAVGWSGDWRASFEAVGSGKVRIKAGLKQSHFRIAAGEKLRLPSVLVLAYRGTWIDGQNQFRRLSLRHLSPTSHPPMKLMPVAASVHGMLGFNDTTEQNLSALAAHIASLKLPLDTFWLDAGWNQGGFPAAQGNPNADPVRFPHGLGPVGNTVTKTGMRFLVWFEPERAMRGTWLEREHPAWLISPANTPPELRYMENDGFRLVDLGNPKARQWALDSTSQHIREANVSVYRQDFNEYPSFFWHNNEPADEIGLREVRYINGLYDFLDELVQRHPGLILDNCASGGRRIDFEMMRRSVVLWRSDSCWDAKSYPRNVQAMTHGLSLWLPLHGLGSVATDDVSLRSGMGACASFAANFRDPTAVLALRRHLERYLNVRPLFASDYFPLTDWSDDPAQWLAFQFHDQKSGTGIVQGFCGSQASQRQFTARLSGLDPDQRYRLTDWDTPEVSLEKTGRELATIGLDMQAEHGSNTAKVIQYTIIP